MKKIIWITITITVLIGIIYSQTMNIVKKDGSIDSYKLSDIEDVSFTLATIPTIGLIAYYPFNGNSTDASGYANNLTEMNGPTLEADRLGNFNCTYYFDGVDDHLISAANNSLDNYQTGSISLWFKTYLTNGNYTLLNYSTDESMHSLWKLYIEEGTLRIHYKQENGDLATIVCPEKLDQNHWYHAVVIADGNNIVKYYIDGFAKESEFRPGETTIFNGSEWFSDIPTINMYNHYIVVGARRRQGTVYDNVFNGMIDDIRIYDRALNEMEVWSLFNEGM